MSIERNGDFSFKYIEVIKAGSESKFNYRSLKVYLWNHLWFWGTEPNHIMLCPSVISLNLKWHNHRPLRLLTDHLTHIAYKTDKHYLALLSDWLTSKQFPVVQVHQSTWKQSCVYELLWRRINYWTYQNLPGFWYQYIRRIVLQPSLMRKCQNFLRWYFHMNS